MMANLGENSIQCFLYLCDVFLYLCYIAFLYLFDVAFLYLFDVAFFFYREEKVDVLSGYVLHIIVYV